FPQRTSLKPAGGLVFKGKDGYPQITFSKAPSGNIKSMTLISYEGEEPLEGFRLVLPPVIDEGGSKFILKGHQDAKFVSIGGFFNGWNVWDMPLKKTDQGWEGTLDLPPGRYPYKFIVDGVWTMDPNNTDTEDDGYGNTNSLLIVQ
ncbi:MAG: glycogen-binding domain-containing protein, partial [Bacteroidota bacterium]